MADPLPQIAQPASPASTLNNYTTAGSNFLDLLLGKTTTQSTQTTIDPAAVQNMLQGLLETGTGGIQGLAGILGSQKGAGLYGSSTAGLLAGNLIAKIVAEIAAKTAVTNTTTQSGQQQAQAAQKALGAGAGAAGLAAAMKAFTDISSKGLESSTAANVDTAAKNQVDSASQLASSQISKEFESNLQTLDGEENKKSEDDTSAEDSGSLSNSEFSSAIDSSFDGSGNASDGGNADDTFSDNSFTDDSSSYDPGSDVNFEF